VSSGSEAEAGVAEPWFYSAPPIKFKPILNTYDNFPISFFPQNTLRSQIKRLPPLNTTIFNIRAYANMATMNMRDTKRFRLLEVQDLMAYNRSMKSALPSPTPSLLDSLNSLPNELKLMILRQFFANSSFLGSSPQTAHSPKPDRISKTQPLLTKACVRSRCQPRSRLYHV
jgi:hypothetical protein